jgi:type II secretory pathway component PulM
MTEFQIQMRKLRESARQWTEPVLEQLRPLIAQGRTRYDKLERRERLLVNLAGIMIAIFLGYNLFYLSLLSWNESVLTRIETRQRELADVHGLVAQYQAKKADLTRAEKSTAQKSRDFSLFSIVEKSLTESVGRDKISSITPAADRRLSDGFTQYTVDLKLEDLSLPQIVDALYGVRTLPTAVAVANLRVTRRQNDSHAYDVDMTCIALAKNG